jgi:hypothetical protein
MENKGQSALEYLMTYGWALVVIVIVIAALFAFGIFNPPSAGTCTGLNKLAYQDHAYNSNTGDFNISLMNGSGSTIADGSFSATIGGSAAIEGSGAWTLGGSKGFSINDDSITSPVAVEITYTTASGITHVETASCTFS